MQVYVAGRFHHQDHVTRVMDRVRDAGHQLTTDWTQHDPIKPYKDNPETSRAYAKEDVNGAEEADVFILIANETGRGSHAELGVALATNTEHIYVIGDKRHNCMFYYHPDVKQRSDISSVLDDITPDE